MPEWLTIVIAVVGLLGTILGVIGVSAYMGERAKYKAGRRNRQEEAQEQEVEDARNQALENSIRGVFQEEITPIKKDLSTIKSEVTDIKHDLANNTVGTVTILRDRMKSILDECREAGFATGNTKANWMELYHTYESLGGNHFKEYVDEWKREMAELPSSKPRGGNGGRRTIRPSANPADLFTLQIPSSPASDADTSVDGDK